MTPRELSELRNRVARARLAHRPSPGYHQEPRAAAGEQALNALARAEDRRRRRSCVYCGQKTRSVKEPATCRDHRDLPAVDPFYVGEDVLGALKVAA